MRQPEGHIWPNSWQGEGHPDCFCLPCSNHRKSLKGVSHGTSSPPRVRNLRRGMGTALMVVIGILLLLAALALLNRPAGCADPHQGGDPSGQFCDQTP